MYYVYIICHKINLKRGCVIIQTLNYNLVWTKLFRNSIQGLIDFIKICFKYFADSEPLCRAFGVINRIQCVS